ncbi:glycosyltransferase involved in cell wall biosynthesis [Microbacterium sp. SLBN-154]|uniref:glycosyltransferase n=1 Tax=Microbacterium sp. SLBN-154 TaxID=2768458 RepID=UPI0011526A5B|nr:glycosyltransferase [Microbacterium sp. SLBN-154]TQK18705.1 glycosyltransferase involved in cell wall biosynthesis [Microbacterium sp. SLBN-154]
MRILHIDLATAVSPLDGIGAVVATLCDAQRAAGHDVDVLDATWRGRAGLPATAISVIRTLRRQRPSVVHLHSVYRPLHAVAAAACRMTGIPYVVSPHSGLAPAGRARARVRKAVWIALVERTALQHAARVVCLSAIEERDVRTLVARARTTIVHNPLPAHPGHTPRHTGSRSLTPIAVTLTRFDVYQKGLDRTAALARHLPEMRFVVHGDVDHNDPDGARRLISDAPANLRFLAPVFGDDKRRLLARADIYVQLSRWEGQSVAVMEAMAAGVPCVTSEAVAETLGPVGHDLVLAVPDAPAAAAEAVRAFLADRERRLRLSRHGGAWAREATDPVAITGRLDAVYTAAVGASRRRPATEGAR